MTSQYRIPVTAITVFGTSILLAVSVAIVLYLGFNQAVKSTQQLWADRSNTLINAMEQTLESQLKPIREQALWVVKDIKDLSSLATLDNYMAGVLAATPQVAGVALVTSNGQSRRWHRSSGQAIDEDWSQRAEIMLWLSQIRAQQKPFWREPIWREPIWVEQPVSTITLLHDTPIYDSNQEFIGVFEQIIPVKGLSNLLSQNFTETGLTPFVLYDRSFVLVHPLLENNSGQPQSGPQILHSLDSLGDGILSRIWTPDRDANFFSAAMTNIETSGVFSGDQFYVFLYREIHRYGPAPWTIGAYINTTIITDDEFEQLMAILVAGFAVLGCAVMASIYVGHKVSLPVKAIALAAETVESGRLQAVPFLERSRIRELDDASNAFNNMIKGLNERELIRKTLGRFVPEKVASALLAQGGNIKPRQTEATILFCDIESFTQLTESLGPTKIADLLNSYFSSMVKIIERYNGVVTQFQGDAMLATFNVPVANPEHASDAVRSACDMLDQVAGNQFAGQTLRIRIGINSGIVFAGAIGAEGRLNYTVHGDSVNLAARLEALNKEFGSRLLVSENTRDLAGDFVWVYLGATVVRGQSLSIKLYTLADYNHQQLDTAPRQITT